MRFLCVLRGAVGEALRLRSRVQTLPRQPSKFVGDGNRYLQPWSEPGNRANGFRGRGGQVVSYCSSSSAVADPDVLGPAEKSLLHVVSCEIEYLMNVSDGITARKPPRPFVLVKDEPEELEITLTRIYGLEDISMRCVLHVVPRYYQRRPDVGEDPEARKKMLQLTIIITKGAAHPSLRICCECYRDGFVIHQVDLESEDINESVYRPYFSESKRKVVDNFQIFLYDRGLNADLVKYIENHLENKRVLKSIKMWEKGEEFLVYPIKIRKSKSKQEADQAATASEGSET